MTPRDDSPLIPAATVVLLRDGADGLETLMLRSNTKLEFVGGMWVFPGGRVDPGDREPGDDAGDEIAPARRAAVREAAEEAGLEIDPAELVRFAHWEPPATTPRRFSTWFFLAPAPEGRVRIDGGEIHAHRWIRPGDAIARRDAGEILLAPPTWVTLESLRGHPDVAAAVSAASAATPEHFSTRIARRADGPIAMWAGDAGYESWDADAPGERHRLAMLDSGWRYSRTR